MADNEIHRAALRDLNRNYVRSVDEGDVAWFEANLAADFFNTNPDGTLIDRKAFLAQIGRGSGVKDIREHDVLIRILGDFAIIHARTSIRRQTAHRAPGVTPTIGSFATGAGNASRPMSPVSRDINAIFSASDVIAHASAMAAVTRGASLGRGRYGAPSHPKLLDDCDPSLLHPDGYARRVRNVQAGLLANLQPPPLSRCRAARCG